MAVIWGLPTWVWLAISGIALVVFIVIAHALAVVFASVRDLIDSLELSQRLMSAAVEQTRDEMEKMQEGLARLSARSGEPPDHPVHEPSWKEW